MLSEMIVTTDGAARCTASAKLKWSILIALGKGTLGNSVARIFGLKNTTKNAIPSPANSGGRTNLKNFSTIFLFLMSDLLMMAQKK